MANHGECLVLDFRDQIRRSQRPLVPVRPAHRRELLDRPRIILTADPPFPGDLTGPFSDRCRRFEEICRVHGIKPEWSAT